MAYNAIRIGLLATIILILVLLSTLHAHPEYAAHFFRRLFLLYSRAIGDIAKTEITTNLSTTDRLIFEGCAPFYREYTPPDRRCSPHMMFRPANESDDITALASFPGSGNTWTRLLIEEATGVYTGTIYCDVLLKNKGFLGEFLASNSVIVVKTHNFENRLVYRKSDREFDSVVFLIRNPYGAILAEANRQWSNGHTRSASMDKFKNLGKWSSFVSRMADEWESTARNWLHDDVPLLVIKYEDLKSDLLNQIKRILTFLEVPCSQEKLNCVLNNALLDEFKRKHPGEKTGNYRKYYYNKELRQSINYSIRKVKPLLHKYNISYSVLV